jgi:hypothetical protein
MIRFLKHNDIDLIKWEFCIGQSRQGLIYAVSWYLDLVSPGWCALVEDDYTAVMPLPVKRKYGFPYIIQPLYAQQLGVYSREKLSAKKISEFVESIPRKYQYIHLNLNFDNLFLEDKVSQKINNNFELSLNRDYKSISMTYSENTRRNIAKAEDVVVKFDLSKDELIYLKSENTASNRKHIPSSKILDYISGVLDYEAGFMCSASIGDETCASVFFLRHESRIYYLIPVSSSMGKEKKAMFAIIDAVIQKFAGSPIVLDFEGSNIPGLARFFEGFGAVNHPYPVLKLNRMPFPLNQFRKF